jgi:hypothetical protein
MSQRLPEQPLKIIAEMRQTFQVQLPSKPMVSWLVPARDPPAALLDVDLHLGQDCGPPDSLRRWPPCFEVLVGADLNFLSHNYPC